MRKRQYVYIKISRSSTLWPEIYPLGQILYSWCITRSSQWVQIKSSSSETNLPEICSVGQNRFIYGESNIRVNQWICLERSRSSNLGPEIGQQWTVWLMWHQIKAICKYASWSKYMAEESSEWGYEYLQKINDQGLICQKYVN